MPKLKKYSKPYKYNYSSVDMASIMFLCSVLVLTFAYFILSLWLMEWATNPLPFIHITFITIPICMLTASTILPFMLICQEGMPEIKYYYHVIRHWKSNKSREKLTQEMYDVRDEATVAWSKGNTKKFDRLIKRHTVIKTKVYDKFY